jgi:TonB family protein
MADSWSTNAAVASHPGRGAMNHVLRIILLLLLVFSLPLNVHSQTTAAPSTVNPAILDLAGHLSTSLHSAGKRRVVILDLRGPQKESHPLGTWLADQLSSALKTNALDLEVVDRTELKDRAEPDENSPGPGAPGQKLVQRGRSVGADAVVTGSFAKISQRLGITLLITNLTRSGGLIPSIRGAVPITDEISGLSPESIPYFKDGVFRAGIGGITSPACIYCPQPEYSNQARSMGYEGTVLLDVLVTPNGRVEGPIVVKSPGLGLDKNAVRTVMDWRLKPAADLDNKPVAARVPIEVSFPSLQGAPLRHFRTPRT